MGIEWLGIDRQIWFMIDLHTGMDTSRNKRSKLNNKMEHPEINKTVQLKHKWIYRLAISISFFGGLTLLVAIIALLFFNDITDINKYMRPVIPVAGVSTITALIALIVLSIKGD